MSITQNFGIDSMRCNEWEKINRMAQIGMVSRAVMRSFKSGETELAIQ